MEFDTLDRRSGLTIFDPVENVRFELYTEDPPAMEPAGTTGFYFPIDAAVGFEAAGVEIPNHLSVVVRTQDGSIVTDATTFDGLELPFDDYLLEVQSTPMKLYIAVESSLVLDHGETSAMIRFDGRRRARVGARSFHERPAGTITVTDDVEDAMAALSLLGSALKTTTCERSFPTLRGHPPLIERGESFDVPDGIERPDTGVELVLPPERSYVYPAASLAYYLGAELVVGDAPRLRVGEFERSLSGPGGYEATVNRILRQVFFLDCLTRTEGYYKVELHERERVEPLVDLDFADLYDRPLAEQLPEYLSVPFETLEPHILDWHLTTDVVPTAETLPALPHFASELSLLRTPQHPDTYTSRPKPKMFDDFTRTAVAAGDFTRSADDAWDWGDDELFQIESADTIEHAWVGNGYPIGANKVSIESLRQKDDYTAPDESALTVHVVCNDVSMDEENVVSRFYGLRDFVAFDVSIHEETTTDELATLFRSDADFIHYIGHVDDDGFHCSDGSLDADTLSEVNVDAFLLNACRSYRQGETLVQKGSKGGVVTLAEVVNSSATKIGRSLARLLNCGFSLRAALSVAKEELVVGVEYVTVGDGGVTLCQSESGAPMMYRVRRDGDEFLLEHGTFPTANYGLGTMCASNLKDEATRYLTADPFTEYVLSAEEFNDALSLELLPVKFDRKLYWSDELSLADL
ncbi:hypothetical protein [Haladaptatus sp. T7]|uniref:hypothetical protein n=1 Tax=Haladaptatus sp. T7 TaxID=2029368 RepID=UPI0021A256B4|nr:hypothetical protein [Haladaptatus sp. T7]GKZ13938.1 hypothetical protein HAL_18190 [Haladaptatus sp. T7]